MASVNDFFTRANPLIAAVLRSPFHWLLSGGLALLTVTGRRSGRQFTFPVGFQRSGNKIVILASEAHKKNWWRNYLDPGPASIRLRGREFSGTAQVIEPGSADFVEHIERTFRRVPGLARSWGVDFDRRAGLSSEQIDYLKTAGAAVELTLDEAPHR